MNQLIQKQNLIAINKKVIDYWNKNRQDLLLEQFAVRGEIEQVVEIVNSVGNSGNHLHDVIEKSAYLMGSIAWIQAFAGGNKRTAYIATKEFLQNNGYLLQVKSDSIKELTHLLYSIQEERSQLNFSTMKKIIFFLMKHVKMIDQDTKRRLDEFFIEDSKLLEYLGKEEFLKK
ncbi:MAG: Fic family protein [Thaumarchaeota archaeon]|nr:Fic family protein [Nitrososphaerota archaeon]